MPDVPAELLALLCINLELPTHGQNLPWAFLVDGQEQKFCVKGPIIVNGINQVHQACLDGYGFANLPQALVQNAITSGRLLTVLDDFTI
ncbi:TPA: hypothetical protein ACTADN_000795 [Salmonella enterica subsp. enterica serovar Birkenhead]